MSQRTTNSGLTNYGLLTIDLRLPTVDTELKTINESLKVKILVDKNDFLLKIVAAVRQKTLCMMFSISLQS